MAMANQEHLDILKQGVEAWNQWREEHPEIRPDLSYADLSGATLGGVNLSGTSLRGADLNKANLSYADLVGARCRETKLRGADLSRADLRRVDLSRADLSRADLRAVCLDGADLSDANLSEVDFTDANLSRAVLTNANFSNAFLRNTVFVRVDLTSVQGLESVIHYGPSVVDVKTVVLPQGDIRKHFLRGTGFPESFIDYLSALLATSIQYFSLFISYSRRDEDFAKRLYADLQNKGVRCWFAPEDMKIGDNIHARIDESIHLYDKLLLVLSKHALASSWVEREVAAALEKEQQQGKPVLFPIRLDETVMQASQAWAADIRRRKHISDFTRWKHHHDYQQAFERLLRDLKAEM